MEKGPASSTMMQNRSPYRGTLLLCCSVHIPHPEPHTISHHSPQPIIIIPSFSCTVGSPFLFLSIH
jgi:hypothetical protein